MKRKTRPSFVEIVHLNPIRLIMKYGYIVAYGAELAHELKPHILRNPSEVIHSETCPLYFSKPWWNYLMAQKYNPNIHDPVRNNGPIVSNWQLKEMTGISCARTQGIHVLEHGFTL